METGFEYVDKKYDLEIGKIVEKICDEKFKKVLFQFPEGLKPYAQAICDKIEEEVNCECMIWMGSCFGACDIPLEVERIGVDLIVQFGHSEWKF